MNFKFRNKEYRVQRDPHQFILQQKVGEEYNNIGYYSEASYLVKKLVSLHCVNGADGKEMLKIMKTCCEQLGTMITRAVKAPISVDSEEISDRPLSDKG